MRKLKKLPPLDTVKQYVALCHGSPSGLMYAKSGKFAVAKSGSLYIVTIKRVRYMAARVLFYIKHGIDPGPSFVSDGELMSRSQIQQKKNISTGRTSIYRGVHWHKTNKRWQAKITLKGKYIYLGSYRDEVAAAEAYDAAARRLFGDLARPNFT